MLKGEIWGDKYITFATITEMGSPNKHCQLKKMTWRCQFLSIKCSETLSFVTDRNVCKCTVIKVRTCWKNWTRTTLSEICYFHLNVVIDAQLLQVQLNQGTIKRRKGPERGSVNLGLPPDRDQTRLVWPTIVDETAMTNEGQTKVSNQRSL